MHYYTIPFHYAAPSHYTVSQSLSIRQVTAQINLSANPEALRSLISCEKSMHCAVPAIFGHTFLLLSSTMQAELFSLSSAHNDLDQAVKIDLVVYFNAV